MGMVGADPGMMQGYGGLPLLPLLSLADPGAEKAPEPLLPYTSHGLWLCRVPGSARDSGSGA